MKSEKQSLREIVDEAVKLAFERGVGAYTKCDDRYLSQKDSTRIECTDKVLQAFKKAAEEAKPTLKDVRPEITEWLAGENRETSEAYNAGVADYSKNLGDLTQ